MTEEQNDVLVGIDIGTHKVLCVIARPSENKPGMYRILGYGYANSRGVRKGIVTDLEEVVQSIHRAVDLARDSAGGVPVERAWASIGGQTLTSENCSGTAVVRGNEVKQSDVDTAESNAREHSRRQGRQLIKMIPQGYSCGDTFTSTSPVGLTGDKVTAVYHAVYGSISNAENMKRCLVRSGIELAGYEPHPWAAAKAVLDETERYCGTVVFDMGEQTTSVALFYENMLTYTDVRPYGAEFFTRDVATVFGITLEQAEELKADYGHCFPEKTLPSETVQPHVPDGQVAPAFPRRLLAQTLRERAEEFFGLYKELLVKKGVIDKVHSVVLTGGGANLRGADEICRRIFGVPVRIGLPRVIDGDSPLSVRSDAAVAIGLIMSAGEELAKGESRGHRTKRLPGFLSKLKATFCGDY